MTAPVRFDVPISSATTDVRFDRPVTIDVNGTEVSGEQFQQGITNNIRDAGFSAAIASEEAGLGVFDVAKAVVRFGANVATEIGQDLAAIGAAFPATAVPVGGAGPQTAALHRTGGLADR